MRILVALPNRVVVAGHLSVTWLRTPWSRPLPASTVGRSVGTSARTITSPAPCRDRTNSLMHSHPFDFTNSWSRPLAWLACLCGLVGATSGRARAQGEMQIAVFPVTVGNASLRELGAALDPVLVSKLQELPEYRVATRPALDLPATQLAVDCMGQTRECLRMVTTQSGVDGLISPSLQVVGEETVITLLYFDGRAGGDMNAVTRRYAGAAVERDALDGVPAMLRQLLGLPEPIPEHVPAPGSLDTNFGSELEVEPRPTAWPALPVVLTATGVALLGAGTALGLAARASKRQYAQIEIETVSDVDQAMFNADRAERAYSNAKTQALLCNIGFAVGGAALVTGVTLWTVHLVRRSAEHDGMAFIPEVGPGRLALHVSGHFAN